MQRLQSITGLCVLAAALSGAGAYGQQDVFSTAIGGGPSQMPAVDANISQPIAIAFDGAGNYYIAAYNQHRVFKVDAGGTLTAFAGTGISGYAGDGVPGGAAQALLKGPVGLAADASGNVYVADYDACVIRRVDATNTITTIAGVSGSCNYNGDGAPATTFHLYNPWGIALDSAGNLLIADYDNCRVRSLALASGAIGTIAGTGTCTSTGDGGSATLATLNHPSGVAADNSGNVYIADTLGYRIREVTAADGNIRTIAGTGTNGFSGDGGPATAAKIGQVYGALMVDSAGATVTFGESNNERIRQFATGGIIGTVAGKGSGGFCGDGGPAMQACFNQPQGLAAGAGGAIYLCDRYNNRVRSFMPGGNIGTAAGNGKDTIPTPVSGIPPRGVVLNDPWGIWQDPSGNVYVSDTTNCMVRVWVRASNVVNIFAGTGVCGAAAGDGGPATSAQMNQTYGIAGDTAGNVYIADTLNHVIRKVDPAGTITTFAGQPGLPGFSGDGGAPASAKLRNPYGVYVDAQNNVYISDTNNHAIRKVAGGVITTVAGIGGSAGSVGDGTPAVTSKLNAPNGVSKDAAGNLYIADTNNCRIRAVNPTTGIINTVAGTGSCGFTGDGPATQEGINRPNAVLADANGNLFIVDTNNERVRWVDPSGNMTTIAGNGTAGYTGDGAQAFLGEMYFPGGIAADAAGNLLVTDQNNLRVRGISAFPALNTSASSLGFGLITLGSASTPQNVTLSAVGPVTIGSLTTSGDFGEYDNCGTGLANGKTCKVFVTFKPKGAGPRSGSLTVQHNGYFNPSTAIALSGTGSAMQITGNPVVFDNQPSRTVSAAKTITLTNKGTSGITMGNLALTETTDFAISARTCPQSGQVLAAAASCTVSMVFKPQSTGVKKGALVINDSDPGTPQVVGVTGTGISNVTLSPATVTFPAQSVGTTTPAGNAIKVTLTNNTAASITLRNPALTITGPFSKLNATSCTNGLAIPPAGTCLIYLLFTPVSVGYATGTLAVADTDATSPQTAALAGTGTAVQFNPAALDFGTSPVGRQVSSTVTITNVGLTTVTFTAWSITGPNAADFTTNSTNPPCSGLLAPAAACTFTMYFTPSIKAAETARFLVYDSSTASPQALPLTGTGQ